MLLLVTASSTMERTANAILGAANIMGVPALGLPQISSLVGRMFIPIVSASPLWSMTANSVMPFDCKMFFDFFHRVSAE